MTIPEPTLNRLLTRSLIEHGEFRSVQSEVPIGPGMRADIIAVQHDEQVVLFELKARPLRQKDVAQITRYTRHLESMGHRVLAHLVGDGWPALERPAGIVFLDWRVFWKSLA